MSKARDPSLLIGPTWEFLGLSVGAGFVTAVVLAGLSEIVLGYSPEPAFIVLVIPVSIALTHYGGGLVPSWVVGFPYAEYALWKGACAGGGFCVPPGPVEILPLSLTAALIVGTVGYVFAQIPARRH